MARSNDALNQSYSFPFTDLPASFFVRNVWNAMHYHSYYARRKIRTEVEVREMENISVDNFSPFSSITKASITIYFYGT